MKLSQKKVIALDADELIQAVEDTRDHVLGKRTITMRSSEVKLPSPAEPMSAKEVVAIRKRLKVSQAVFAQILNVPVVTEVSWEKGRRHPSGAALRLLQIARKRPQVLMEV